MSDTKFTKGEWTNRTVGDPTDNNGSQIYAGKLNIATCHYGASDSPTLDETKSNANLIAAAPEMYKALDELLEECFKADNEENDDYVIDGHFLDNARRALAKARGEQIA